jgi:hypothetical protein
MHKLVATFILKNMLLHLPISSLLELVVVGVAAK